MPISRLESAQQTREQIVQASMRAMARHGYAGTNLADITQELGLTRGAVYRHFPTKAHLYEEILLCSQQPIYELLERLAADPHPAIEAVHTFMTGWMLLLQRKEYRISAEIFFNKSEMIEEVGEAYEKEKQLTREIVKCLTETITRGVSDGQISQEVHPRRCAIQVYAQLMGLTQAWLFNPRLFALKPNVGPMVDAFVSGLLPVNES